MTEEESDIPARIEIAKNRRDAIGKPLETKMRKRALSQPPADPDKESTIAPDVSGTGMSPFEAAARQGTLPAKDVSAEDRHKAAQRAKRAKRSSSTG